MLRRLIFLALLVTSFFMTISSVSAVNLPANVRSGLWEVSMGTVAWNGIVDKVNKAGLSVFQTIKVIISGLAIIYLVYAGSMMIVSSSDDGSLAKSKKQFMYTLVAFLFINIPGQAYNMFTWKSGDATENMKVTYADAANKAGHNNFFVNFSQWDGTVQGGVLMFIRVGLVGGAIFMFTLAALSLIGGGGDTDKRKAAKEKFLYGTLSLVFLGIIETWLDVVYKGDIIAGQGLFRQLSNMAIFFAGPTAIFFLILGSYYYITSGGSDEQAKKGKNIVVYTFLASLLLLASYTFLNDLSNLTF